MKVRLLAVAIAGASLLVGGLPVTATATSEQAKVTNGEDAAPGAHPYTVALLNAVTDDRWSAQYCVGSLVDPEWVMTAAYCVTGAITEPAQLDVLVGSVDLGTTGGERIRAAEIVVHPTADLALVRLSAPATLGTPVAYAGPGDAALEAPGTLATLTGWGGISGASGAQTFPTVLQAGEMPILPAASCDVDGFDAAGMLCAGDVEDDADGGVDACLGDSGGPLVVTSGGVRVQVGLVGLSPSCGRGASAYTRVSALASFVDDTLGGGTPPTFANVERIAGANRYATAANLAVARFAPGVAAAFVVTGTNFPDALAAAPAAATLGAPVLLTQRDTLPGETVVALQTLAPGRIIVVGGGGAVSDTVVMQLDLLTAGTVTRIAGATRYDTAVLLSQFAFPNGVTGEVAPTVLASGESFADALGGAALAAGLGVPLLLTPRDAVLASTKSELWRLALMHGVLALGGTAAISEGVITEMGSGEDTEFIDVIRIAGADRYETSAIAAGQLIDPFDGDFSAPEVVVATGVNFPDGLVAGALGAPLLLLPPDGIPAVTTAVFGELRPGNVLIMGGTGAVSDAQAARLDALVGG